jgi:hypothetical protein
MVQAIGTAPYVLAFDNARLLADFEPKGLFSVASNGNPVSPCFRPLAFELISVPRKERAAVNQAVRSDNRTESARHPLHQ